VVGLAKHWTSCGAVQEGDGHVRALLHHPRVHLLLWLAEGIPSFRRPHFLMVPVLSCFFLFFFFTRPPTFAVFYRQRPSFAFFKPEFSYNSHGYQTLDFTLFFPAVLFSSISDSSQKLTFTLFHSHSFILPLTLSSYILLSFLVLHFELLHWLLFPPRLQWKTTTFEIFIGSGVPHQSFRRGWRRFRD
jgi:hypothetical protein